MGRGRLSNSIKEEFINRYIVAESLILAIIQTGINLNRPDAKLTEPYHHPIRECPIPPATPQESPIPVL